MSIKTELIKVRFPELREINAFKNAKRVVRSEWDLRYVMMDRLTKRIDKFVCEYNVYCQTINISVYSNNEICFIGRFYMGDRSMNDLCYNQQTIVDRLKPNILDLMGRIHLYWECPLCQIILQDLKDQGWFIAPSILTAYRRLFYYDGKYNYYYDSYYGRWTDVYYYPYNCVTDTIITVWNNLFS